MGILGAGHAGTALAAKFAANGFSVTLWAPERHPGAIPDILANDNNINAAGVINGAYAITPTTDVGVVVRSAKLLFIVTRADVHDTYVSALEEHNDKLADTDLFVVCGQGFTMTYGDRLNVKRILESSNSPAASKLTGPATVNIKEMKTEFQVSCYPIHRDAGRVSLPADLKDQLAKLLPAQLVPCLPLQAAFASNYITHAVAAMFNIGRLRDPADALTERAKGYLSELDRRDPPAGGYFFYGRGSNTYVNKVQEKVDAERRAVAAFCGIKLDTLLKECNDEYGTDYANLREYCLVPTPHNVQFACPDAIEHRYYSEEMWPMEFVAALAGLVGTPVPLTTATIVSIQAARDKEPFESPRYKKICGFTREDLTRFGAMFV